MIILDLASRAALQGGLGPFYIPPARDLARILNIYMLPLDRPAGDAAAAAAAAASAKRRRPYLHKNHVL